MCKYCVTIHEGYTSCDTHYIFIKNTGIIQWRVVVDTVQVNYEN